MDCYLLLIQVQSTTAQTLKFSYVICFERVYLQTTLSCMYNCLMSTLLTWILLIAAEPVQYNNHSQYMTKSTQDNKGRIVCLKLFVKAYEFI